MCHRHRFMSISPSLHSSSATQIKLRTLSPHLETPLQVAQATVSTTNLATIATTAKYADSSSSAALAEFMADTFSSTTRAPLQRLPVPCQSTSEYLPYPRPPCCPSLQHCLRMYGYGHEIPAGSLHASYGYVLRRTLLVTEE
mmetsp:Transcript_9454/g.13696  ORF Transcript_9454/g.13696 Transcript_9454/m.13696 type:complete len:142 (-) Transcript_9454:922-1347(-)